MKKHLFVVAHPDDEVLGAGAFIYEAVRRGDQPPLGGEAVAEDGEIGEVGQRPPEGVRLDKIVGVAVDGHLAALSGGKADNDFLAYLKGGGENELWIVLQQDHHSHAESLRNGRESISLPDSIGDGGGKQQKMKAYRQILGIGEAVI